MKKKDGSMIDMILEYNINPNKACTWRGIPPNFHDCNLGEPTTHHFLFFEWVTLEPKKTAISDHRPYLVTVKTK